MKVRDFFTKFPDESSCKAHFKVEREKPGVVCKWGGGGQGQEGSLEAPHGRI